MILKNMLKCESRLDRVFQALSDPSRRAMVERLGAGQASLGELAEPLAMSLSAVQQHLAVLRDAGLVSTEKIGRTRMCRLERAQLDLVDRWLADRRAQWECRIDRLETYLKGDSA
jgi:DNA-binding transcriptional ArsR family regulator